MSLKGVCSIEIRNEDGSLAQKTTDENMVTNFISNLINPDYEFFKGLFDKNVMEFDYALYPLIDKVIGGVFLFGDTLPEDPDYRIPKAPLIGHASSTYQHNIPTAGLFNQNESTVLSDTEGNIKGFKYVWDFATDKANGAIKCVSLTTGKAGSKGYSYSNNSKIKNDIFTMPCIAATNRYNEYYPLNVFETSTGNFLLSVDTTTKGSNNAIFYGENKYDKLLYKSRDYPVLIANIEMDVFIFIEKVTENSITFTKRKLKKNIGIYDERDSISKRLIVVEEKTIDFDRTIFRVINNDILNEIHAKIYTDDQFIYVSGNDYGNLYIYKLDPKTITIVDTRVAVTDIEGVGYHYSNITAYQKYQGCVEYEGYFYTTRYWDSKDGSSNHWRLDFIKIDIMDTNNFETIRTFCTVSSSSSFTDYAFFSIYDKTLFCNYYNPDISLYLMHHGGINYFTGPIPINFVNIDFPYVVGNYYDANYSYTAYGVYNQGLITIDNLSTPIIKNSTQTMKITYEITEE